MKSMIRKQIKKFLSGFRRVLHKYRHVWSFPSDPHFPLAHAVLFREGVEASSGIIVRNFTVDLSLVGMDAINATGRVFYGHKNVVAKMSRATLPEGKLHFFQAGRYMQAHEVEAEYSKRGLVPIDPHTLCAFNGANPEFADTHPNGTQWKDVDRHLGYTHFCRSSGERYVIVHWDGNIWYDYWWFAGIRK